MVHTVDYRLFRGCWPLFMVCFWLRLLFISPQELEHPQNLPQISFSPCFVECIVKVRPAPVEFKLLPQVWNTATVRRHICLYALLCSRPRALPAIKITLLLARSSGNNLHCWSTAPIASNQRKWVINCKGIEYKAYPHNFSMIRGV